MADESYRTEDAYEIAHPRQSVLAAVAALGLEPGQQVLDVGCGAGPHLGLFAEAITPGGRVVGLDLAADRLALAAAHWGERVADGSIALREGDHDALPARTGEFDAAWSSAVLHHAERPLAMLGEMARVVRPGGVVAVLDGDTGGSFPMLPWSPELELRLRQTGWEAQAANFDGTLPYHFAGYVGRQLPRRASAIEVEARVALHARAYGRDPATSDSMQAVQDVDILTRSHPTIDGRAMTVIEDTHTGRLASPPHPSAHRRDYDGIPFPVGEIEHIAADPAYRQRGLVCDQFDRLRQACAARDELVQVISGILWCFRQFGYELALARGGRVGPRGGIPPLPPGATDLSSCDTLSPPIWGL